MSNKLITLITGANQGIGYYAAQQLATTGKYHVLLGSRNASKGQKAAESLASENVEALQIDVSEDASIGKAAETVKQRFGRLDILINNAGISTAPGTLREQYHALYDTNLFGASVTTENFLPLLRASTLPGGKRILFVSSNLSSLTLATDPASITPANQYPLYRSTKTALNMIMANYHVELKGEDFVVGALCPGYCGTNLNGFAGFKDPREGARTIVRAVEAEKGEVECRVIHGDGPEGKREGVYPW